MLKVLLSKKEDEDGEADDPVSALQSAIGALQISSTLKSAVKEIGVLSSNFDNLCNALSSARVPDDLERNRTWLTDQVRRTENVIRSLQDVCEDAVKLSPLVDDVMEMSKAEQEKAQDKLAIPDDKLNKPKAKVKDKSKAKDKAKPKDKKKGK